MLKPTSLIMGAGLGHDVACMTDGRFSGGCVFALLYYKPSSLIIPQYSSAGATDSASDTWCQRRRSEDRSRSSKMEMSSPSTLSRTRSSYTFLPRSWQRDAPRGRRPRSRPAQARCTNTSRTSKTLVMDVSLTRRYAILSLHLVRATTRIAKVQHVYKPELIDKTNIRR